jgi:iron complex outermembrane receptor protein
MSSSSILGRRRAAALAAAALAIGARAEPGAQLDPVIVTGNPLRSSDLATPLSVLAGDGLVLRRGSSLAETLADQPGLSSTYFGPNANRPIVRGLDGERVRILNNASASFDASTLSYDHAVPIDPLAVERIEVLRGPAALLYGGSAIGGVVNAIDNRIPRAPVRGVGGTAELRLGGAEAERGGAALVEAGDGRWAWHADAFDRQTSDLRVPRFTPVEDGTALDPTDRVRNSAAHAQGGGVGGSYTFGSGHVGLALDRYDNRYGVVAEPDVTIRMRRDHLAAEGEWRELDGPLRSVRTRLGRTVYEHREIEGDGSVGTLFASRGNEARLEAEHAPLGAWRGVLGAQWENIDFAAQGTEAFVPSTTTKREALFVVEETSWALGRLSAGARIERARIVSAGDVDPAQSQFGPAQERRFSPFSLSVSNLWKFAPAWSLSATIAQTQRAPTAFELYANGVHAATAAYERGDPTLRSERGRNLDVTLRWAAGASEVRVGVFDASFSRYVALSATGATVDVPADGGGVESLPEYVFRATRAQLRGVEAQAKRRVAAAAWALDLSAQIDFVRGDDLDRGEPLARIAPTRLRLGIDALHGPWTVSVALTGVQRQSRVPSTDTPTAGDALLDLALARQVGWRGGDGLAFVKLSNAGNVLARSATTIPTVRDLAPLPGRAVKAGLRLSF